MGKNRYHVANPTAKSWHWTDKDLDWDGIRAEGQEAESTIDAVVPPKPSLGCAFLNLN